MATKGTCFTYLPVIIYLNVVATCRRCIKYTLIDLPGTASVSECSTDILKVMLKHPCELDGHRYHSVFLMANYTSVTAWQGCFSFINKSLAKNTVFKPKTFKQLVQYLGELLSLHSFKFPSGSQRACCEIWPRVLHIILVVASACGTHAGICVHEFYMNYMELTLAITCVSLLIPQSRIIPCHEQKKFENP